MTGRAQTVAIGAFVLCVVACTPRTRLNVESDDGVRVFAIIVDAEDEPKSIVDLTDGERLSPFDLERTDRLLGFRLSTTDYLVGGTAERIDATKLATAIVGLGPDPTKNARGCGRCLAPVAVGPQPVFEGDSCSLTSNIPFDVWTQRDDTFERTAVADLPPENHQIALARALHKRVVVEWPGDCACDMPTSAGVDPGSISFDLLVPPWSGAAFEELAIDPENDTIGAFSSGTWFVADGAIPSRTFERTDGPPGTVIGAVPLVRTASVSRFFVATLSLDGRVEPKFHVVRAEPTLPIETVTPTGLDAFFPNHVRRFVVDGAARIVMSGMKDLEPAVAVCDDERACRVLPMTACDQATAALDVAITSSGVVAALVEGRRLAVASVSGAQTRCVDVHTAISRPPEYPSFRLHNVQRLSASGDRVYVCTRMVDDAVPSNDFGRGATFAASAPLRAAVGGEGWAIEQLNLGNADYCDELLPIGVDRMAVGVGRKELVVLGGDGRIAEQRDWKSSFGENVIRARAASTRQLVMTFGRTSAARSNFLGHGVGRAPITGGRAEVLQGGPFPDTIGWFSHEDFAASHDGSIIAVPNGADRRLQRIDNGALEELPVANLYPEGGIYDVMVSAVYDRLAGNHVVSGTIRGVGAPNRPWWRRVDVDAGQFLTGIDDLGSFDVVGIHLTEVVPGTIVYTDDTGRLFSIRGNSIGVVDVVFDDPRTDVVEGDRAIVINDLVEADGVAWAIGSGGFLARLVALPVDDPAGRVIAAESVLDPAVGARNLTSGVAHCADSLAVIGHDVQSGEVATIGGKFESSIRAARPELDLQPERLLRSGDRLIRITRDRWVLIDDHIVGRAPFYVMRAHTDGGWLAVSGFADRLAVARLPLP